MLLQALTRSLATASLLLSYVDAVPTLGKSSCKNIPGDHAWPTSVEWDQLNQTVSGQLIGTIPLAIVCHIDSYDNYNETACAALQAVWDLPATHSPYSGEIDSAWFQNDSCVPFTPASQPCELGNYVSYSINVTGANDVIAGLQFAEEKNVRLVIKNTGHDFLGKSTGKGGLGLWMHNLKTTEYISNYKSSYYNGAALKIGAGITGAEAYTAAHQYGCRLVGGECPTVGLAGGYTQGGGHSLLNSVYGMGADNALEWEVVTAQGQHLVATPTQNADLYWALSGGGGGTYGVVLSLTTRLYQDGEVGGAALYFNATLVSNETFWAGIEAWHTALATIVDAGIVAIYELVGSTFSSPSITAPGMNATQVAAQFAPFLASLDKLGIPYSFVPRTSATYFDHFSQDFGPLPGGSYPASMIENSRLIPRATLLDPEGNAAVVKAMQTTVASGDFLLGCNAINVGAGGNFSRSDYPDNAVLPYWRDAMVVCLMIGMWDWDVPRSNMEARESELINVITPAFQAASGSGAYLNEASFKTPDWQEQFYGTNYDRLRAIKKKYDPNDLFYAVTAVGSDAWVTDSAGRLCRA
ncbi:hypothetical protein BP6252_05907 [Coleophoma cylindrospora]|uniref:FAD-binding PCMH-type domain-containing protein n=1 Tax=Coleophoma cylindrospora TaxID=1849047 RepID=A0A3D8RL46_9HELO|nr:hypothetical protein BP6252_05907 [Coleophoma cylindrospora]